MTENIVRISDDVSYSNDRAILARGNGSSDGLLIWRRENFDAQGVQRYIDHLAASNPDYLKSLDKLRLEYFPDTNFLTPQDDPDEEVLQTYEIIMGRSAFRNIFPGEVGKPLVKDIETRLPEDTKAVFPTEHSLVVMLRTLTSKEGETEPFHIDNTPVLSYTYDLHGTEFITSMRNVPPGSVTKNIRPGITGIAANLFSKSQIEVLKPGDVSLTTYTPHRNMGLKKPEFKVWLGVFKHH